LVINFCTNPKRETKDRQISHCADTQPFQRGSAVAEASSNDKLQKAVIGFAMAGNGRKAINARIDHKIQFC